MILTRARMLLNKTVFEAEILIEDKYTVYAGILDLGWSTTADTTDRADTTNKTSTANNEVAEVEEVAEIEEVVEVADFEFADYYDYLRIFNAPYERFGHGDNEEGESFRNDNLSEAERKEIYSLCKRYVKEVWQNDRTEMKAGEWNDGQWQTINFSANASTSQLC